jgi:hypothetical protein
MSYSNYNSWLSIPSVVISNNFGRIFWTDHDISIIGHVGIWRVIGVLNIFVSVMGYNSSGGLSAT